MVHEIQLKFDDELECIGATLDKNLETICIIDEINIPYSDARDLYEQIMLILINKLSK